MLVTRMTLAAVTLIALTAAATAKPLTLPAETNLRAAPGTKSEIITLIPKGSAVEVGECDAGWCKVKFGDKEGFVIGRNVGEASPQTTATRPQSPANSQANLQKLRRGYEQHFGGNNQNDITGSVDEPEQYSQNTPPRYAPPRNARPPQYDRRVYDTEDLDDEDDIAAYVPTRPPVYYSYGPYPRAYYAPGPYYYRRW